VAAQNKRKLISVGHLPVFPFWPGTAALIKKWNEENDPEHEKLKKEWSRVFGSKKSARPINDGD
jgi:hypothetical protein